MTRRRLAAYSMMTALIAMATACGDDGSTSATNANDEMSDETRSPRPPSTGDEGESAGGGAGGAGGSGVSDDADPETAGPESIVVKLERIFDGGSAISFGLPLPRGRSVDPKQVRISSGGDVIEARVKSILSAYDAEGHEVRPRSLLIQFDSSWMSGDEMTIEVAFEGGESSQDGLDSFANVSKDSPDIVNVAERSIERVGGEAKLVETQERERTLFVGREPNVLATFPKGYLAKTGILGLQMKDDDIEGAGLSGLSYLSSAMREFASSSMYEESFAVNPEAIVDPVSNYEGWLYDRCATFLTAYAHTEETRFLRHAYRSCSYYSSKIRTTGNRPGIFTGKSSDDTKYSHLRGLYAYYALTGDESAFAAGKAIADLWHDDRGFVAPYREGRLPGKDKMWTERLLGTSLEGLYYGHLLTGDSKYLRAMREMVDTAHAHITGDAAALSVINPGHDFPPQNCFIHSAGQHDEGNSSQPWCSGWMSELIIDPLLGYEAQTKDARVGEIFIRLARFLRDTGSAYFYQQDVRDDYFLEPSACYKKGEGNRARRLVPLYGSGLRANGRRDNFGEYADIEHCADATALTAAAIRALKKAGGFDEGGPIGPFATEGESFLALHHELSACAQITFKDWTRPRRSPLVWTSKELEAGLSNPGEFIRQNKIGWPIHQASPQRKLSWWFNKSMLQFGLLQDAGIEIRQLEPGQVGACNE